ncbi:hypothetical protein I4U23_014965 [Adineta vaga]|nr:hypothetical protein I4U23_014965 [Adineta vaga]
MSRLTRKSISSQTRESSDDTLKDQSKTINSNNNEVMKTSTDVCQETTSKQRATSTTIRKDYKYIGDMYAEKKHGSGVLSWFNDQTYTGSFFADKRHGFGSFQKAEIFEFKGLYRHDERFGPGVLTYQSSEYADVGFWFSNDLIRLLYPHPTLNLSIHITDKKPRSEASHILSAWYSPHQLLSSLPDLDFILDKKPSTLLCKNMEDKTSLSFTQYLIEHANQVQEVLRDRRAQLDAYTSNFQDENTSKEMIFNERIADISTPNETDEQRQLFYHTNRFLPLKQQATFLVDDILSNTRSAFPEPGPLEKSSLFLFELAYNGETKQIRDLLMHTSTYVDVCDSRGLTALHFATYNLHLDVINTLLDFGANVNQLTDDGLTPLSIAFLFYYGNNPFETINKAFEHSDLIYSDPKSTPIIESRQSSSKEMRVTRKSVGEINITGENKLLNPTETNSNSYGYELTEDLRERMRDEQFRETVLTIIKLLLRRGADPSLSDWPLPVLALAIRAGDREMVELLLKKKAEVNCRLNPTRHASLTPLHIACGSLEPTAFDIVRLLLEHGAQTNVETSPVDKEYLSLADPLVCNINKKNNIQSHGRTPLHIACTREVADDTLSIIRSLVDYQANPNIVCNGQTPLSLAISTANESVVDLLLDHKNIDPAVSLGEGNGNALCTISSTTYGSRWSYDKRIQLVRKDTRIAQTPYHILSPEERVTYKERKELLAYMAKRFREEVTKNENLLNIPLIDDFNRTSSGFASSPRRSISLRSPITEKPKATNSKGNNEFHFCATCGRSTGVRLTPCKQCEKVYFCSKTCRTTGWDAFHQDECQLIDRSHSPTKVALNDKILTESSGAFSKKTSQFLSSSNQFSTLSAAKLIRQKRLKQLGRLPTCLDGVDLSWNYTYDGPENYSFS